MGHTFQLYHTYRLKIVYKYKILIKLSEVKKNVDKMPEDNLFVLHFSSLTAYSVKL